MKKILIVDDEKIIVKMTKRMVEKLGFLALPASTVSAALELIASESPDTVLLDLSMPEMHGIELATLILQKAPDTHIVAMSGHTLETIKEQCMGIKLAGILAKPFCLNDLEVILKNT